MTTTEELQQLSRDAAGCLLEGILGNEILLGGRNLYANGMLGFPDVFGMLWLHESTEACTEIMLVFIKPFPDTFRDLWMRYDGLVLTGEMSGAPAFRVATLRTYVALKGKL
jgi:hypothetical protein